jgi:Transglycosylase SLT domain
MTRRLLLIRLLLCALAVLALAAPAVSLADEPGTGTTTTPPAETTVSTPPPEVSVPPAASTGEAAPAPSPAPVPPAPAPPASGAPAVAATPQVQGAHSQGSTAGRVSGSTSASGKSSSGGAKSQTGATGETGAAGSSSSGTVRAGHAAPSPSTLTPSLPLDLESSISGVPGFFIESFRIPPFLLPIYQAAGTAYGIPWQVLAAINEVETDYGRDLSVSSAGAEGWMQFLPAEWVQYGVDANGDGFKDPYNPADAIFAAARYLRAAGGDTNIKAAVYSYNHSQAYVDTVMLRAQLLGGSPAGLLGAITGLTEARFPVHATAHFADGFPTVPAGGSGSTKTLVGTTIYAPAGAPVIAVQDGEIVKIGDSPTLGRFISLRDVYGNTYVYAQLANVSALYPVLVPRDQKPAATKVNQPGGSGEPVPSGPATAGAQSRSPVSEGADLYGLALGAAAPLESAPAFGSTPATPAAQPAQPSTPSSKARVFREGSNDVYLHHLRPGVQVIAGTVLGHIGTDASESAAGAAPASGAQASGPHMLFQIRPAGPQAPLIDPKPILDGWVALENTSIFRAKGENPFIATSPTVGQVLLESKQQLETEVLQDRGIHLAKCGRQDIQAGGVDKRVLATLQFLSVSALKPTVSGLRCSGASVADVEGNVGASSSQDAVNITAVNGIPVAGHAGRGSITDIVVRRLLKLEGTARPQQIISLMSFPGATNTLAKPKTRAIHVSFASPIGVAHAAGLFDSALTASQWTKLVTRLGEIPDPTVTSGPSPAAIPDRPGAGTSSSGDADGNG